MKKVKILINREPLSKNYVQSKQNFGQVLSQVKKLKPPIWKSPWFYGPVGLAVVALSVTAVNSLPPDESNKTIKLEAVLPLEQRKIEAETLAFISPKEDLETSFREMSLKKIESEKSIPKVQKSEVVEVEEITQPIITEIVKNTSPITEIPQQRPLSNYPSINRVFTGEILITDLCSNVIECKGAEITSFSLQYYNGAEDVVKSILGNSINHDICESISKYNRKSMIFITKIKGVNNLGQVISYPSMNLIPVNAKY